MPYLLIVALSLSGMLLWVAVEAGPAGQELRFTRRVLRQLGGLLVAAAALCAFSSDAAMLAVRWIQGA